MNEIAKVINYLEEKGNSKEIIRSTLEEMIKEDLISPEEISEMVIEDKKKIKHFDDFLDEELDKYGLAHGYMISKNWEYLSKHEIFIKDSEKEYSNGSVYRKDINSLPSNIKELLDFKKPRGGGDNIVIGPRQVKITFHYAEVVGKFKDRIFNENKVYTREDINNISEIKVDNKEYKPILKKVKKTIKNYCRLIKEGYKVLPREKRPIIFGCYD